MTNYSRGRSREYRTMELLRSKGWVCGRSAMSHGPVDIFAAKRGRVLLVQVKSGSARPTKLELVMLKRWARAFGGRAEVWLFKKGGELVRTAVQAELPRKRSVRRTVESPSRNEAPSVAAVPAELPSTLTSDLQLA